MSNSFPFPLEDPIDNQILMHRDVHFGGSFSIMRAYYKKKGKGVQPEFELSKIQELQRIEEETGKNLSDFLPDTEKEEIARAKAKYHDLRNLYENPLAANTLAELIADLILSEKQNPNQEIAALVSQGQKAVLPLIELLKADDFYNPLFPGYGEAPALAARCLGLIGDERAIAPLFHALGKEDFFTEEAILDALTVIGDKSKEFLINALRKMPISKENEHAAIALIGFKDHEEIAKACLSLLQNDQTLQKPTFAAYLVMGCHSLNDPRDKELLIALSQHPLLAPDLRQEMQVIIKKWKKKKN